MFGERFKMPEDLGMTAAYAMLEEIFTGGAIDSTNQAMLLLLCSLASGDNISSVKLSRVTEQSIQMLRHVKEFFNVQFKIKECEDDVYNESSSSDSEAEEHEAERDAKMVGDSEVPKFPKGFIFSCIGVGLTNIARKIE